MRKLITAIAMGALAGGLVAAPSALAVKAPKPVSGTVTVVPTPTTITPTTTTVAVEGNVAANSSCRKDRTVHFSYVNADTLVVTPLAETAVTGSNGDYTAVLPKPADAAPASVILRATVDQVTRKVGSAKKGKKDKKGRQFNCLELTGDSAPLTVSP
jgi:hypothetical protein